MFNKVILIGNVGKDPEVKTINDTQVAKFSLATSESYKDKQGVRKTITEWHNIECWGNLAGIVESYVKKGSQLLIEGKNKTNSWEKDGEKKYMTVVKVDNLRMMSKAEAESIVKNEESLPTPEANNSPVEDDDLPF